MALSSGTRLGPYEILGAIGSGGMGEVYRARDTRLGRDVALKVLPDLVAHDPELLARFAREAQLLASLNHPHIAAVYGLEESGQYRAIVQELVEGPTLAERIAQRPIGIQEAFVIAREIIEALEAAHQRGIIHRDLKPANIKLTPDGRVKLLDFGLAKALADEDADQSLADSPTALGPATRAGVVLGTAAYMSPEQACGARIDRRADIWAFGCVLFEMLAGRPAFPGRTISEVLGSVLHTEPDWSALPGDVAPAIRRVLRRCLAKDPKRRLRDIADARLEMEDPEEPAVVTPSRAAARRWGLAAIFAGAGVLLGGLVTWSITRPQSEAPSEPIQFMAQFAPVEMALNPGSPGRVVTISPDGRRIVFVGRSAGQPQLWVRPLDRLEASPIPGTQGAFAPFFSPDSRWVGFFSEGKLRKVSLAGGAPVPIADVDRIVYGGSWGTDGTILVGGSKLVRVSADGGTPEVLAEARGSSARITHRWPEVLPGGKAALFTLVTDDSQYDITTISFETREQRAIIRGGTSPLFVGSGYVLYAQQASQDTGMRFSGGLFAVRFDAQRLEATGPPFPVLDGVYVRGGGAADFAIARTGTLVYTPQRPTATQVVWVDREGNSRPLADTRADFRFPRLSPDGRFLSITMHGPNRGVWLYDLATGSRVRLTTTPGEDETPVWSPDGKELAFASDERGIILRKATDPTAPAERLAAVGHVHLSSWSPDGRFLAFEEQRPDTGWDICLLQIDSRQVTTFLQTPFAEFEVVFSPDGRWVAYASNASGRFEVYVAPFPGPGSRSQVSRNGGRRPAWSRDGRELFFRSGDAFLAADVALAPAFSVRPPRVLFRGSYQPPYDVMPDGRQFVTLTGGGQDEGEEPTGVRVVINWIDELQRRAAEQAREGSGR